MAGSFTIAQPRNPSSGDLESTYNPTPTQYTVTGTGFGTKLAQRPAIVERFATGANGQLLSSYDPAWVVYDDDGGILTNSNPRYTGALSVYNDYLRGQFATNYKQYPQTRAVFLSYYVRVNGFVPTKDGGVTKYGRVTSSTSAGGGGVYNGEGVQAFGGGAANDGFPSWSGSENGLNSLGYTTPPLDAWFRLDYEIYLNDVDTANGFYNLKSSSGINKQSGMITQRKTGYSKVNYLLDTTLLGLEIANPWRYYKPVVFTAFTTYSVVVNGITCSWTSGASVPTANEICTGLRLDVIATGGVGAGSVIVYNDEIQIDYLRTSVYDSKFEAGRFYSIQVSDIFLDTSLQRFVLTDSAIYSPFGVCEAQEYTYWSDTEVELVLFAPTIVGNRHLHFVKNNADGSTTSTYFGVV